ncbi:unnamed protein product [Caenorhabditis sp. 36 PRJEB53466]|nr:unnamed protein product [Caenorhabditis sp. 36 PRJEB53466]
MSVPTLFQLSTRKVAEHILNGSISTSTMHFSRDQSNLLYEQIVRLQNPHDMQLLQQLSGLHTNRINLKHVEMSGVAFISEQELESFVLGNTNLLLDAFHFDDDPASLDIVSLLNKMFNTATRQSLRHLDISGFGRFKGDWLEAIGAMLPNLVSLNVAGRRLVDVRILAHSFPRIQYLNVSNCDIEKLDGISGMRGLQVLIMENPYKIQDMTELFELRDLRVLNLSCPHRYRLNGSNDVAVKFCQCLEAGHRLPELRYLDLSKTTLTERIIETILRATPTIRHLTSIDTGICLCDCFETYNLKSMSSTVRALEHYLAEDSVQMLGVVLNGSYALTADFQYDVRLGYVEKEAYEAMEQFVDLTPAILHRYKYDSWTPDKMVENLTVMVPLMFMQISNEPDSDAKDNKIVQLVHKLLDCFEPHLRSDTYFKSSAILFLMSTLKDSFPLDTPNLNVLRMFDFIIEIMMTVSDNYELLDMAIELMTVLTENVRQLFDGFGEQKINETLECLMRTLDVLMQYLEEWLEDETHVKCSFLNCALVIIELISQSAFKTGPAGFVSRLFELLHRSHDDNHIRTIIMVVLNRLLAIPGAHDEFYATGALETLRQSALGWFLDDRDDSQESAFNRAFLASTILCRLLLSPERIAEEARVHIHCQLLDFYRNLPQTLPEMELEQISWTIDMRRAIVESSSSEHLEAPVIWTLRTICGGLGRSILGDEAFVEAVRALTSDTREEIASLAKKVMDLQRQETKQNARLLEQLAGLNMRRVNLKQVEMTSSDVALLGTQELQSFVLGHTNRLLDEYHFEDDLHTVSIVSLLSATFNAATRQSLRHLDISGCESFNGDWLRGIGSVLANLVSLNVAGRRPVDIRTLGQSFPGLQYLNVSNCDIDNLDGISGLQGLRVLIMENAYKIRDMTELFELRNLSVLNLACPNADGSNDVAAHFCQCLEDGSRLPKLRTLDLSKTALTEENAETIMRTVPTIQHLSTIGTGIDLSNRVEGYSTNSLNSTTKALEHYLSEHSAQMIGAVLKESFVLTDDFHFDMTGGFIPFEDIMMFTTCMVSVLRRYQNDGTIQGEAVVNLWTLSQSTTSLLLADADWSDKITEWVAKLLDVFDACDRSNADRKRFVTNFLLWGDRDGIFTDTPVDVQRVLLLAVNMLIEQKDDAATVESLALVFRRTTYVIRYSSLGRSDREQASALLSTRLDCLASLTLEEEEHGNEHFTACINSCFMSIREIVHRFGIEAADGFVERLIDVLRHSRNNKKSQLEILELLNRLIGNAGEHEEFRTPSAIETLKLTASIGLSTDENRLDDLDACNIAFLACSLLSRLLLRPGALSEEVGTEVHRYLLEAYSYRSISCIDLSCLGTEYWIDDVKRALRSRKKLEAPIFWALQTILDGLQYTPFRICVDEDISRAVRRLIRDDRKGVADLAAQVANFLPEAPFY